MAIFCALYREQGGGGRKAKEKARQALTILFHRRYCRSPADGDRLSVNMGIEFNLRLNPACPSGLEQFAFVAYDITIPELHTFSHPYLPTAQKERKREYKGVIQYAPAKERYGWIYDPENNEMVRLPSDNTKNVALLRAGLYCRFNVIRDRQNQLFGTFIPSFLFGERTIYKLNSQRLEFG